MSIVGLIRKRPNGTATPANSANDASGSALDGSSLAKIAGIATPGAGSPAMLDPAFRSHWWRIATPAHERVVLISGYPTAAEVQGLYPRALIQPVNAYQSEIPCRPRFSCESEVKSWLDTIGEQDDRVIAEVLDAFRSIKR